MHNNLGDYIMKKYLLALLFALIIFNTAFASLSSTTPPTCPTSFPAFPLTATKAYMTGYMLTSPIYNNDQIALYVNAPNMDAAIIRAKEIIASNLTPAWTQAHMSGVQGTYFCAYLSNKYNLHTFVDPDAAIYWILKSN
jgi:hypothetical protein